MPDRGGCREEIAGVALSGAVLDINLEGGLSFDLARELMAADTPFIFINGYDRDVIPDEFAGITRFQKPVEFKKIIATLGEVLGASA